MLFVVLYPTLNKIYLILSYLTYLCQTTSTWSPPGTNLTEKQQRYLRKPPKWREGNTFSLFHDLDNCYCHYCELYISMVSCQKGPTRHAHAWQIRPFWQDTLDIWDTCSTAFRLKSPKSSHVTRSLLWCVLHEKTARNVLSPLYCVQS